MGSTAAKSISLNDILSAVEFESQATEFTLAYHRDSAGGSGQQGDSNHLLEDYLHIVHSQASQVVSTVERSLAHRVPLRPRSPQKPFVSWDGQQRLYNSAKVISSCQ